MPDETVINSCFQWLRGTLNLFWTWTGISHLTLVLWCIHKNRPCRLTNLNVLEPTEQTALMDCKRSCYAAKLKSIVRSRVIMITLHSLKKNTKLGYKFLSILKNCMKHCIWCWFCLSLCYPAIYFLWKFRDENSEWYRL